jgi:hypothetical protein
VFSRQMLQPHEHAHGLHPAGLSRGFRPLPRVWTDRRDLSQQGVRASLDGRNFFLGNVLAGRAKSARLRFGMDGHPLETIIEDADQTTVPPHPESMADILLGRRVIGFVHLQVPVAMHGPMGFVKEGEPLPWQRQQFFVFDLVEELCDLLLGRAVNSLVRDLRFRSAATPASSSPAAHSAGIGPGSSAEFPVGAFGGVWALARAKYLPIVSRFLPSRVAISRFESSALWSVRIVSISAIESRFAI